MSKFISPEVLENLLAFSLAVFMTSIFLLLLGVSPWDAFVAILEGSILGLDSLSRVLVITSVMSLSAFALIVTFSCNMWNIGIEGQMMLGAIGAVFVARTVVGDTLFAIPLMIMASMAFGGGFGILCGILRTKGSVHEIFAGLGLDFVAAGLIVYLVIGPWKKDGIASTSGTDIIPNMSWFPHLFEFKFPVIPVLLFATLYMTLKFIYSRTALGLKLKSVGSNPAAFSRLGLKPDTYILMGFLIAGAVVGLAGAIQVGSIYHKLVPYISGGYGFLGILIALVSDKKLSVAVIVSIFFACLVVGGSTLQIKLGLHASLPGIIQASIVLFWLIIKASSIHVKLIRLLSREYGTD
tara:strand:- start:2929 stop:3984 length:1056 start_codon:yes stop_codon:yes gene_type:complete